MTTRRLTHARTGIRQMAILKIFRVWFQDQENDLFQAENDLLS